MYHENVDLTQKTCSTYIDFINYGSSTFVLAIPTICVIVAKFLAWNYKNVGIRLANENFHKIAS